MNEHLRVSDVGVRLITGFEGPPRLEPRECEGGRLEMSWGVTFHPDGRPVQSGEKITHEYAEVMFRHALNVFEQAVKRHVTVELNQHQFDALVSLVYNIGEHNFAYGNRGGPCTVLREVNARRWEDAADAFGMWLYATKGGYKKAYRGLLRRRYAEACCFLGYDWNAATADDDAVASVSLQVRPPPGDPPKGVDGVIYKTPFKSVLAVAQDYPLPEAVESELFDAQEGAELVAEVSPAGPAPLPSPALPQPRPASSKAEGGAGAVGPPAVPAPSVPKPVVIAPKTVDINAIPYGAVDPSNGVKNMTDSKRFAGMLIVAGGSVVQVLAAREVVTSTAGAIFYDMSRDPVLVALAVGGIFWAIGHLTRKRGQKVITDGMVSATQVLK